ncbi:MAG: hypothetical protein IKY33_01530 [Clostridia bacterium]|nr:hypothetical protein [Clostridia bacterium]
MKVYELMDLLSRQPAGAEISVNTVMTSEELEEHEILEQTEAGENLYRVTGVIDDVDKASEHHVNLFVSLGASI